ncbi:hypothetical protein GCM10011328_26360 [Hafnia psychrotolerans]|uniref:Uncharacterized protein n=1 Tax=Hafnia psychrotolerans TaxID=1477018 RepID=A0ABQ1GTP5_9GAMM|nr:hypothetical protein GCM10011328_26360 [Hafnia psychrotolerans]
MSVELVFMIDGRAPGIGIGVGEICTKKYPSLLEANLPKIGDKFHLQHGSTIEQSSSWEVTSLQRFIFPESETYWVICKYLG